MRHRLVLFILFFVTSFTDFAQSSLQVFDRENFYAILSAGKIRDIDEELLLIEESAIAEKQAYAGALLMRKAGLVKKAPEKLKLFKEGRSKLEKALREEEENGEYSFLRLTIQEHAPRVVKYFKDMENDKLLIQNTFRYLSPVVQNAILDYCKTSQKLKLADFQIPSHDE